MSNKTRRLYEFGPFRLDTAERTLFSGERPVTLTPKVFDLLVLMLENPGRLLEKENLLKTLWPETFVEEANLSVNVSTLRKALGESPVEVRYIETVPKRGYRFVADVKEITTAVPVPEPPPPVRKRWSQSTIAGLVLGAIAAVAAGAYVISLSNRSGVA